MSNTQETQETQMMNPQDFLPTPEQGEALIAEALQGGAEGCRNIQPLAFAAAVSEGADLSDPQTFLWPSVEITPTINPLFHALMVKLGAVPNGLRTYEVSAGKDANPKVLRAILEVLPGEVCYTPDFIAEGEKAGFQSINTKRSLVFSNLYNLLRSTPAGETLTSPDLAQMNNRHPDSGPLAGCAVIINASKGRVFIKVCSNRPGGAALRLGSDETLPDLDRLRPGGKLDPQQVTPDRAVTMLEAAAEQGYEVVDGQGQLGLLRSVLSEMVVAQRVPGAPGQGRLVVGSAITAKLGPADQRLGDAPEGQTTRAALVPAGMAGAAVAAAQKAGAVATLDPQVADVIAMSAAEAAAPQASAAGLELRDYQREAVGLHLATEVGFLQCCSVGLGKTAMTLSGMRAWAERKTQAEAA